MSSYTDSEKHNSEASRLQTTLQGFGQAVVITQNGINANLEASWKPHQTTMDTADATIVGTLAAPSVEFIESEKTKAIFYVNLSKVDIAIYVIVNRREAPKEIKRTYSDWKLAYEVDFSFEAISELPEEIKQQVKNLSDYTAQQIVIDFSTTNLDEARPKYSKYNGLSPDNRDVDYHAIKNAMDDFGKNWIDQIKDKKVPATNILGYALKSDPAKGPPATLVPKDLTLQTYPYYRNGNSVASELVKEDSCFCFLNVFEGHDFPRVSAGGAVKKLDFAGNLVAPFAQISKSGITMPAAGSITLSGDAFWSKMKPTLDALSRATFFSVTSVSSYADTWYPNNTYDYSIGIGEKNKDTMPNLSEWVTAPPVFLGGTGLRMSMMKYDYSKESENVAGPGGITTKTNINAHVKGMNTFTYTPGKSVIHVSGSSEYSTHGKYQLLGVWHDQEQWGFSWSWSYDIALSIAPDGTLKLEVQNPSADDRYVEFLSAMGANVIGRMVVWMTLKHMFTAEELKAKGMNENMSNEEYAKVIHDILHDAFNVSVTKMNAALGTVSEFVFPAAGQYWMANPRFTSAGDLTCDLGLMAPKKSQA